MSLSADLRELKRMQREEVLRLHRTYLRSKRQIRRGLSPARAVRKHPAASLGIAAVLGFLLAPRGGHAEAAAPASAGSGWGWGSLLARIKKMLKENRGGGESQEKPAATGTETETGAETHRNGSFLESMAVSLIGAVKLDQLFAGAIQKLTEAIGARISRHHEGNGRHSAEAGDGAGATAGTEDPFGDEFDLRRE